MTTERERDFDWALREAWQVRDKKFSSLIARHGNHALQDYQLETKMADDELLVAIKEAKARFSL